jgi:serine phosphatase RsbU (regulator of sigma subunit)
VPPALENGRTTFATFVAESHLIAAHELPTRISRHAGELGFTDAQTYLVDLQQQVLVPFLPASGPGAELDPKPLPVASTLAGRAFQHGNMLVHDEGDGPLHLWAPLLDGTERLGVLAVRYDPPADRELDVPHRDELTFLASLVAGLVMSKTLYGDTLVRLRRTSQMSLAAEIQWALLPPLTFVNSDVSVAAALEPAYEVAGDSVDYSVEAGSAKFAVFDGMGHALSSAQMVGLVVAAYRHARRSGQTLSQTAQQIDAVVHDSFSGLAFVTGLMVELDLGTGLLTWISAGHPPALLLRNGRLVKALEVTPMLPLGLGPDLGDEGSSDRPFVHVGVEQLEPGDLVLLYTDGVTEARSPSGEMFGEDRLTDLIIRNVAAGLPPAETMRRAVSALMQHQGSDLADDATLLLASWRPQHIEQFVP